MLSEPVGLLDYSIPAELAELVAPGVAVEVPLRNRATAGYVASIETGPPPEGFRLKAIRAVDDDRPRLPEPLVQLILFAADYYAALPGEMLATAVPSVKRRAGGRFQISERGEIALSGKLVGDDRALLRLATANPKGFSANTAERELGWTRKAAATRLRRSVQKGWLTRQQKKRGPRLANAYHRTEADPDAHLSPRQRATRELLDHIPRGEPVLAATLAQRFTGAYKKLKTLEKAGLVERVSIEQRLRPADEPEELATRVAPTPTEDQARALQETTRALDEGEFRPFLLQGVTSSGKTEVYLQLIDRALSAGKTALVLVPEIALTPQLGARFRARFGDRIATFHSGLSEAERRDEWERIASGDAVIGLGARSALFLPLRNIGVIVVDEEHETSFKQDERPRYNARDLAVYRARLENAVIVLGSATPSLESRYNAEQERYQHLLMPRRVGDRPLPEVERIDMAHAERVGDGVFSRALFESVQATLAAGDQAILFLNRRGFAPYVYCRDCGVPFRCDDCDVALTLHRGRDRLICHYCAFEMIVPEVCPACHSLRLEAHGLGTERLESEVRQLFGELPIARLDRDTVRKRTDLDEQLGRFRRGEAKLMIGTQMVTKGHDFPGVTLVGIVAADASLNFPDFRSAERTFQLLTQVSGRAGRGDRPGRVLVQTYEVDHYAITAASTHDFESFVAQETEARRELSYPPFSHLVLVRFEGQGERETRAEAEHVAQALRAAAGDKVSVLGPAPAPLSRLRGLWRWHVLLKGQQRNDLRQTVAAMPRDGREDVRRVVDVDPISML